MVIILGLHQCKWEAVGQHPGLQNVTGEGYVHPHQTPLQLRE
jgi:hypothetical protein